MIAIMSGGMSAEAAPWEPPAGHTQVPLWPEAVPDAQPVAGPEHVKPVDLVENVSQPCGGDQHHFDKRLYPAVDAADKEICRSDFGVGPLSGTYVGEHEQSF